MKSVVVSERADARGNRHRLIEAAEAVFTESGGAGSTEEVARRAGLGVGTVFRHFPTKQALLEAIVVNRLTRLAEAGRRIVEEGHADGFYALFAMFIREVRKKRLFRDPVIAADNDFRSSHADIFSELVEIFDTLIARGRAGGLIRVDFNTEDMEMLLIGAHYASQVAGKNATRQQLLLEILMAGVRPQA